MRHRTRPAALRVVALVAGLIISAPPAGAHANNNFAQLPSTLPLGGLRHRQFATPFMADPGGWSRLGGTQGHEQMLDRVRALLSSSRLSDSISAAASLSGVPVAGLRDLHSEIRAPESALKHLPLGLERPVARLAEAVRGAAKLARSALPRDRTVLIEALDEIRVVTASYPGPALSRDPAIAARAARALARYGNVVNRERLYTGALGLARAIDETLPALRAASSDLPAPRGSVAGCEIVDQAPALCVAGTGSNTIEGDYALVVDLGGDDLHTGGAGAADIDGNGLAASVTIDIGGDDRYEAVLPTASGATVAQGSTQLGGIGMLVDALGDDRYSVTPKDGQVPLLGQAFAVAGVGLLADLAGSDSYTLANRLPGGYGLANGQAFSAVGGGAVMLDASGDDTYVIEARPEPWVDGEGLLHPGTAQAQGMGTAGLATAVFADGGGSDAMSMEAATAPITPDETRPLAPTNTLAWGFGVGSIGGVGVALTGPGASTRIVRAATDSPLENYGSSVEAYAVGLFAGFGASDDAGGNDAYVAEATSRAVRRLSVDDACGCFGVEAVARAMSGVGVSSHGVGAFYSAAILRDEGGGDRYSASARLVVEADARDERTRAGEPAPDEPVVGARAVAAGQDAGVAAQAFGLLEAPGILHDLGGDDLYESLTSTTARATASATLAGAPTQTSASSGDAESRSQAYGDPEGVGELHDNGGTDTYVSSNSTTAETFPEGNTSTGTAVSTVQVSGGFGVALLVDADGGRPDVFTATPPNPACSGTRGEGVWQDCGAAAGVGLNT